MFILLIIGVSIILTIGAGLTFKYKKSRYRIMLYFKKGHKIEDIFRFQLNKSRTVEIERYRHKLDNYVSETNLELGVNLERLKNRIDTDLIDTHET
jgi:t-SNARE complex subunit (syntaxin)